MLNTARARVAKRSRIGIISQKSSILSTFQSRYSEQAQAEDTAVLKFLRTDHAHDAGKKDELSKIRGYVLSGPASGGHGLTD